MSAIVIRKLSKSYVIVAEYSLYSPCKRPGSWLIIVSLELKQLKRTLLESC
jgi:hypothetical protein